MPEKRKDLAISSQALPAASQLVKYPMQSVGREGSETIMRALQNLVGGWDSPFLLETKGIKEPRGLGANPSPATWQIVLRKKSGRRNYVGKDGVLVKSPKNLTCIEVGQ